jgi:hypothetical protein
MLTPPDVESIHQFYQDAHKRVIGKWLMLTNPDRSGLSREAQKERDALQDEFFDIGIGPSFWDSHE